MAIQVAIGILVHLRGDQVQVLIARRRDEVVLGGYWELPGGKLDPGETPDHCAAREFEEELALRVVVGRSLPIIEHRYDHGLVRLHPFYCTLDPQAGGDQQKPQNLQVAEHRWVSPGELSNYRFPPANVALIQTIQTELSHRGLEATLR